MNFQEKLAAKKKNLESSLAPSYVKIMHRATKELERSGIQNKVLKVGDTMPVFELMNQNKEMINSSTELKKGPLILTFYRGFWCPYCNLDLANLNTYLPRFNELGAQMLSISPERMEYSKKIIAMQKLNFDILWDIENLLAQKLGLKFFLPQDLKALYQNKLSINLKLYHGDAEWALPMPARFLVDTDGVILYAESSPDYTKRPDPDDLLEILKSIK